MPPSAEPADGSDDSHRLIAELFPFYLLVDLGHPDLPVVSVGRRLADWLPGVVGNELATSFSIVRPHGTPVESDSIRRLERQVCFLEHRETRRRLRGEFIVDRDDRFYFVGSPLVTAEDRLEDLGLGLNDFAAHDATGDIVILAQFATLQIGDIERQQASLTELAHAHAILDATASTDALTGVANRRALWARWEHQPRAGDEPKEHTLIYIDVDGFKQINDEFGHHVGDEVLRVLAERMRHSVKETDLVARLGGDEFVLLLSDLAREHVEQVATRLHATLRQPVSTSAGLLDVSVSMGVAQARTDDELDVPIRDADTAMYRSRLHGRGQVSVFDPSMGDEREERRALTQDLRAALEAGDTSQVLPYFQPIVDLETGRTVGFEALARWLHPVRGFIGPDVFVPLAEQDGLIAMLDTHILEQALAAISDWRSVDPALMLHANVSGRSLGKGTATMIESCLRAEALAPSALVVEVTESWFIDQSRVEVLEAIADLGVGLQLDDFGTGFSSMTHLQSFPIEGLKIDRSFVANIDVNDRDRRLVEATLGMAKSLQLDVVAEGVETEAVARVLADLGCRYAQGFLYSRPVPASDASALITQPVAAG